MFKVAVIAIGVVALSAPAAAQDSQAPQPAAAKAPNDLNKIVCKHEEQIGTRLGGKRVCLTVQQWLDRQREDQDTVHKLQQDAAGPRSG